MGKKNKIKIVGESKDGKKIIDGSFLLFMKDSRGIPLEVTNQFLKENDLGFCVKSFINACIDNPNYSLSKTRRMLQAVQPKSLWSMTDFLIYQIITDKKE